MRSLACLIATLVCGAVAAAPPSTPPSSDVARAEAALAAGDRDGAVKLFGQACAAGDQHACARKAFYLSRDGDPAHVATAFALWTTACDHDDALACSNLGTYYSDGTAVPPDVKRAAELWTKACRLDDNFACGALAISYSTGAGVERDLVRAFQLADKGCRLGSSMSCVTLGMAWTEGWSGASDPHKAVALFDKACQQDSFGGCVQLAFAVRDGRGVARDPAQSRRYLEKACRLGAPKDFCEPLGLGTPLVARPRDAGPRIVLSWGGAGAFGASEQFAVDATGAATYDAVSTTGAATHKAGRVTKAALAALATTLRTHAVCALRADPHYLPVPEEHHTTVSVDFEPDLVCAIELHANEWQKTPHARAIDDAIHALMAHAALRAHPR